MKRRKFLILGSLFGLSSYIKAEEITPFDKEFEKSELIISAVQEHFFPENGKLPSAKSMKLTKFLFETMKHKSFDRDIKAFILDGAEELNKREKGKFINMSYRDKEYALRKYEETNYGSSWLSQIMTYSMEGLFSDPIYGSNIEEAGWKELNTTGGFPSPKRRYLDV